MNDSIIHEPWNSFLLDLDNLLEEETALHCFGGFVVTEIYGSPRETMDVDVVSIIPRHPSLVDLAGRGSALHKKHKVYLDRVGIATVPENYEERLTDVFSGQFARLRLFAFDPYDIALAKMERNRELDRADVLYLAKLVPFDLDVLEHRYHQELRPYLGLPEREDLTLKLWIEMIEEDR